MVTGSQSGMKNSSQTKILTLKANMGAKSANSETGKSMASMNQGKSLSRMKVRRKSYGFGGGVAGIKIAGAEHRSSLHGADYKRPQLLFLPTYRLEPRVKFHVPSVEKVINKVLDFYFTEYEYNVVQSPGLTVIMAGEIMKGVKAFYFDRYRIIAVVTIAQKRQQSYNNAVAFLWDHTRDNLVDIFREVSTAFVQVTVFGVYLD
ncbi:hypothetical protein B5X24_HaOG209603 [Helicoverpa armigera]|nr:hypothetical protein B5X24_HaOG209603 [Helicoverpa armigera]